MLTLTLKLTLTDHLAYMTVGNDRVGHRPCTHHKQP